MTALSSKERKNNTTIKSSAAEVVADPMTEYLKTVTAQGKSQESEDPTLKFFKSLVLDVNKLNFRKQSTFKAKVMELSNLMLVSQANSEMINSRSSLCADCL